MIQVGGGLKVLLATQPVDFRRGVHGLAALVAQALSADPYCGDVFIFRSKRSDRLKLIVTGAGTPPSGLSHHARGCGATGADAVATGLVGAAPSGFGSRWWS